MTGSAKIIDKKTEEKKPKKSKKKEKPVETALKDETAVPAEEKLTVEEINELDIKEPKEKHKLTPIKIERISVQVNEAQHPEEIEGPQFTKLKLKKPSQKPKQELTTVTLPKFQLKSRIKYINDWPPLELKPAITFLGSVKQNGELSRNIKEAAKIKKKPIKVLEIPDLEKIELEKPEVFDFTSQKPVLSDSKPEEKTPNKDLECLMHPDKETSPKDIRSVEILEIPEKVQKRKPTLPTDNIEDASSAKIHDVPIEKPQHDDQELSQEKDIKIKPVDEIKVKPEEADKLPQKLKKKEKTKKTSTPAEKVVDDLPEAKLRELKSEEPINEDEFKKDDIAEVFESDVLIQQKEEKIEEKPKKHKKTEIKEAPQKQDIKEEKPIYQTPEEDENEKDIQEILNGAEQEVHMDDINELKPKRPKKKIVTPQTQLKSEVTDVTDLKEKEQTQPKGDDKKKSKLVPIKIERNKVLISEPQHAESVEGPQFTKLKLKKTVSKPKQDTSVVILPKFQLKSRIKYINDWPPTIINPTVSNLGSIRQNGILSRNVKEAAKIKRKIYKEPELPEIEKTELEKPMFGYEDIIEKKTSHIDEQVDEVKDEEPEQFTIKPRRPSVKKSDEIVDEITIKKKLKPIRKPSITLPEVTEPETVTFRPKTTKTKEEVEQEFNIHLDSYAEEEISLTSKVKLKPQRQPTFTEEADEASIQFYEEKEGPDIVEVIESDEEVADDTSNVMMSLKKAKKPKKEITEDIISTVTVAKPKPEELVAEIMENISLKLDKKPKYVIDDQEEVSFDVKPQIEQFTTEDLSLSSKIKLKSKKKTIYSEAADETSIKLTQEIEDDSQAEEIIMSEGESEDNVEMLIKRKPKKPAYEVSEMEELSVELKPKRINEDAYEEEQLTILAKRKPRKPSQLQGIFIYGVVSVR